MVFRKHNSTAGFSLIEVLVAITILGLVVVPIGSSLVLSFQLNARSEQMLQAQLAVSSTVETIMAEGYDPATEVQYERDFKVEITANKYPAANNKPAVYYALNVTSKLASDVYVNTYARPKGGVTG